MLVSSLKNHIVSVFFVASIAHVHVYCIWLRSLCWNPFIVFSSRVFAHVVEETIFHRDTKLMLNYVDSSLQTPLSKKKFYSGCGIPC